MRAGIKTLATKEDIAKLRKEFGEAKAGVIKWMCVFWMGQIGAMLGMIFYIRK